ncbi:hypothetical protein [Vibrio rotiferianus]|uniref:hypothetical protein n=1 Tax=Vibrio rotiferianus TaxID=190895 RepID=UPI001110F2EC|nr:hypothetical protein [Vibrio rotiferianus]TMX67936.1 hypothetical protein DA097_07210 [Vibrio rotiferianus]
MKFFIGLLLLLLSSSAFSAQNRIFLCNTCSTNSEFENYAKIKGRVNRTIEVEIFNENRRILKKYEVKVQVQYLPNGEPSYSKFSRELPVDTKKYQDLISLLDLKNRKGQEINRLLSTKISSAERNNIYVPERIAESPWDLIGRGYSMTQLSNYINPSIEGSYWDSPLSDNSLISVYVESFLALGAKDILGLDIFNNKYVTLTFKSGGTVTFELTGFANGYFDFNYNVKYPILDASGNIVAEDYKDLRSSRDFSGQYLFDSDIDESRFRDAARRSNWEVIPNGVHTDRRLVCYTVTSKGHPTSVQCFVL